MQTAIEILIWAIGIVTIIFFVVIIIAVLKISSEYDDVEFDQKGLKDGSERKTGRNGEEVRVQGRVPPADNMEQDKQHTV